MGGRERERERAKHSRFLDKVRSNELILSVNTLQYVLKIFDTNFRARKVLLYAHKVSSYSVYPRIRSEIIGFST
jgi:hypothetical protein